MSLLLNFAPPPATSSKVKTKSKAKTGGRWTDKLVSQRKEVLRTKKRKADEADDSGGGAGLAWRPVKRFKPDSDEEDEEECIRRSCCPVDIASETHFGFGSAVFDIGRLSSLGVDLECSIKQIVRPSARLPPPHSHRNPRPRSPRWQRREDRSHRTLPCPPPPSNPLDSPPLSSTASPTS
ncbi:hypothetical protein BT69DRAFT_950131 [Atractiella rhizophila]|nr:hypothetical protein BT69DRAFT_950131 [Atractiella rhizophila]